MEKKRPLGVRYRLLCLGYVTILIFTLWAEYRSYMMPMGNGQINGVLIFSFFTNDSNILLALSCLLALPSALRGKMGKGVTTLRLMATTSVALTFWTVALFLAPLYGFHAMYYGEDYYLHIFGPLFGFLLFMFLERDERVGPVAILLSGLPMALYGSVYAAQVVFLGRWRDFYGLIQGGNWILSFALMMGVTLLLGLLHGLLHNRLVKGKQGHPRTD